MGRIVTISLANSGAGGSNPSYDPPRGCRVLAVYLEYNTDANAGNRDLDLDGMSLQAGAGFVVHRANIFTAFATVSSTRVSRISEQAAIAGINQATMNAPLNVGQGGSIRLTVTGRQAGDTITNIRLILEHDEEYGI